MSWFEELTGLADDSHEALWRELRVEGEFLVSRSGDWRRRLGRLELPSLLELRGRVAGQDPVGRPSALREVVADVRDLHRDPANAGALIQAASQFNLLEMPSPHVTPEDGVADYEHDHTQGPMCAISCGAGLIYRNSFIPLAGGQGQSTQRQVDCLADLGTALGNHDGHLWRMVNGYVTPSAEGLVETRRKLEALDEAGRDHLRSLLRIGLHWDQEVTLPGCGHLVSQAYCAAVPVSGGSTWLDPLDWEPLARLVLEATYEATLAAAVLNNRAQGPRPVFLTLVGGGVFGNRTPWILDAIRSAVRIHHDQGLDIRVVSYGRSNPDVRLLETPGRGEK